MVSYKRSSCQNWSTNGKWWKKKPSFDWNSLPFYYLGHCWTRGIQCCQVISSINLDDDDLLSCVITLEDWTGDKLSFYCFFSGLIKSKKRHILLTIHSFLDLRLGRFQSINYLFHAKGKGQVKSVLDLRLRTVNNNFRLYLWYSIFLQYDMGLLSSKLLLYLYIVLRC